MSLLAIREQPRGPQSPFDLHKTTANFSDVPISLFRESPQEGDTGGLTGYAIPVVHPRNCVLDQCNPLASAP